MGILAKGRRVLGGDEAGILKVGGEVGETRTRSINSSNPVARQGSNNGF